MLTTSRLTLRRFLETDNNDLYEYLSEIVNAGEKFPDFAGFKFPLSGKKIY